MGQQGRRLQLLARGEADHLLVPEEPEFTLIETTALDSPLELLDSLLFVLSPMLEKILRKAMERAYALRSVRLTLHLERGRAALGSGTPSHPHPEPGSAAQAAQPGVAGTPAAERDCECHACS